jgi:hypothetical protein
VARYKVYCIDGGEKVVSAAPIEADGDDAAVAILKERHGGYKCELWEGVRLVARLDLRPPA